VSCSLMENKVQTRDPDCRLSPTGLVGFVKGQGNYVFGKQERRGVGLVNNFLRPWWRSQLSWEQKTNS